MPEVYICQLSICRWGKVKLVSEVVRVKWAFTQPIERAQRVPWCPLLPFFSFNWTLSAFPFPVTSATLCDTPFLSPFNFQVRQQRIQCSPPSHKARLDQHIHMRNERGYITAFGAPRLCDSHNITQPGDKVSANSSTLISF